MAPQVASWLIEQLGTAAAVMPFIRDGKTLLELGQEDSTELDASPDANKELKEGLQQLKSVAGTDWSSNPASISAVSVGIPGLLQRACTVFGRDCGTQSLHGLAACAAAAPRNQLFGAGRLACRIVQDNGGAGACAVPVLLSACRLLTCLANTGSGGAREIVDR